MSGFMQELARAALVGSERSGATLPAPPQLLAETLSQLAAQAGAGEAQLLRAAGVAAVCGAAGYTAPGLTAAISPCADETAKLLPEDLHPLLADVLIDGPLRLQYQMLAAMGRATLVLPPAVLPRALELGRAQQALREPLRATLGVRGEWLAGLNEDWRYARGLAAEQDLNWDEAVHEQRLRWLREHLPADGALARERIVVALPQLSARERLQMLECLLPHLAAADESFLEGLLRDRAKEVRQTTASALAALPGSALAGRMTSRLAPCLEKRRKLLREIIEFNPPQAFDAAWKADTIEEEKPQHEPLGPRAWWAFQLVRLAPLAWWQDQTGLAPSALLDWAKDSEWADALLRGWLQALERQPQPEWIEAWLGFTPPKSVALDHFALANMLPAAARETAWGCLLRSDIGRETFSGRLAQLINTLAPGGVVQSPVLVASIIDWLEQKSSRRDYTLLHLLPEIACILPLSSLPRAVPILQGELQDPESRHENLARFITIAEQRLQIDSNLGKHPS